MSPIHRLLWILYDLYVNVLVIRTANTGTHNWASGAIGHYLGGDLADDNNIKTLFHGTRHDTLIICTSFQPVIYQSHIQWDNWGTYRWKRKSDDENIGVASRLTASANNKVRNTQRSVTVGQRRESDPHLETVQRFKGWQHLMTHNQAYRLLLLMIVII